MTPADVSVVIPALNEAQRVGRAVASAWEAGAGQVVVCDGGSEDDTVAEAARAGADLIAGPRGRGWQLRTGTEQARGEWLLFLHADNWLDPVGLRQLCRCVATRHPIEQTWGGFKQTIDTEGAIYRALECGNAARIRLRGIPFGDQAMFVTRTLYDRVGGFPAVPLMEDVVLARRLRQLSWPVLVDARVHVDARRWRKRGVLRQTVRNWGIQSAHGLGVSEERLAEWYR